jgi:beta-carotene ketolase (CrtW type)
VNLFFGRLTLLLYAGFWMDRLTPKHFDHHKHVGTEHDPDFAADHPTRFWRGTCSSWSATSECGSSWC